MMLEIGIIVVAVLAAGFIFGSYVAVVLGYIGFILFAIFSDRPAWAFFGHSAWNSVSDTTLVAIPFFILMGEILIKSGLTEKLYRALSNWLGRMPGGLLHTNIATSAVFGSISGSSVAVAATIGNIAVPQLYEKGYSRRLTLGSLAAGGTLGVLIPPSLVMIIYGVIAKASVGDLFVAALIPSVLMAVLFMGYIAVHSLIDPKVAPKSDPVPLKTKIKDSLHLIPVAVLFFIVIGSIYFGIASPTESATFGTVGAFLIALAQKAVNKKMLKETVLSTVKTTGMIMMLLMAAGFMQLALGFLGVQSFLGSALIELGLSPTMLLLLIIVVFLFLGSFVDDLAIMITMLPFVIPVIVAAEIDLIWFGVLVLLLMGTGLIAPVYGMNLFVLHGVQRRFYKNANLNDAYLGALPFVLVLLFGILLLFLFPELATWLPQQLNH